MEQSQWTSRDFDPQALSEMFLSVMEGVFSKAAHIPQTKPAEVEAKPISEYGGRMKVAGLEQMDGPCYISTVNFYSTQADMDKRKGAKGAFVLYMEAENAGKFFKALELPFPEDEDDASMIAACGRVAEQFVEAFKNELSQRGYVALVSSAPRNYKNSIFEGVDISPGQKFKHYTSFYHFKHKTIAADLTLAPLPKK